MENFSAVKVDGQAIKLVVRPEFEKELPDLNAGQYTKLTEMIKRDGVLDPIKYRVSETGDREIIDGHHRFKIANELNVPYEAEEIRFKTKSVTNVLYWMHVFNAARRGGKPNSKRMVELWTRLQKENGKTVTKTEAVKQTAKDTQRADRAVWRDVSDKTDKPSPFEYLAKIIARTLKDLSAEEREQLKAMFQ